MDMKPVESSNVKSVGYDPKEKTLAIQFSDGSIYHYADVDGTTHQDLIGAKSIGSYIHKNIKGIFKHVKQDKD